MEVYLDIYLILNFIMNFFLICMTGILRQQRLAPVRWGIVSLFTGILSTGLYALSWVEGKHVLLAGIFLLPVMVFMAYRQETWSAWRQDLLLFVLVALLTGGSLTAMLAGIRQWLLWLAVPSEKTLAVSIWGILIGLSGLSLVFLLLGRILLRQIREQKTMGGARLIHRGEEYDIRVLFDSGNQLRSPYTGEKVAVMSAGLADRLRLEESQLPLWIPYHSIGGEGLLPAYRLDRLELSGQDNWNHFLAAVSDRLSGESEIQMIVNIT